MIHAFWMSLFSSIIGPFGGFFASGFKRAFKIKVIHLKKMFTYLLYTLIFFFFILGFWRCDSRTWRYYGSF